MTGRRDDRAPLAPSAREEDGHSVSLARELLATDIEAEERFLARLESMEVPPAGRHRRRQIAAVVVACLVFGSGAAAMVGVLDRGDRQNGAAVSPPPNDPDITRPAPGYESQLEAAEQPIPTTDQSEPAPILESRPPQVPDERASFEPAVPPQATGPGQESLSPEIDGSADPPTIPEDALLLAQIGLQRGSETPPQERLDLLQDFLTRFPDSAHVGEVRALIVEALADAGRDEDALFAVEQYLAHHPDDSRRQQVRWLEATLARDRLQDCERALPAYRELAGEEGPWQEAAEQYVEVCSP